MKRRLSEKVWDYQRNFFIGHNFDVHIFCAQLLLEECWIISKPLCLSTLFLTQMYRIPFCFLFFVSARLRQNVNFKFSIERHDEIEQIEEAIQTENFPFLIDFIVIWTQWIYLDRILPGSTPMRHHNICFDDDDFIRKIFHCHKFCIFKT